MLEHNILCFAIQISFRDITNTMTKIQVYERDKHFCHRHASVNDDMCYGQGLCWKGCSDAHAPSITNLF
jgi:hypothetical protein